jgi:putative SOS response-associated peptidase YedK
MPVILPKEIEKRWLDNKLSDNEIKKILKPYPDNKMKAHTISRLITSKTLNRNVPKVIEPYSYPELNELD